MKVGYIQSSPIFGEKEKNFTQIENLTENIKADLVVLPELFATGYTFISKKEAQKMAEVKEGQTAEFLKGISRKTGAVVIGGFIEKEDNEIYNSSIMIFKEKIIETYRKIHLYYKEKLWFSPGNKKLQILKANGLNIGIMICFDWIFPETARTLALLGADIIAHPANLVLPYCQKAMVTRCLENNVFAVTSNRIGQEKRGSDTFNFTGASQITSNKGEILSSAPIDKIFADFVDLDVKEARNKKINDFNDILNDRRDQFYYKG